MIKMDRHRCVGGRFSPAFPLSKLIKADKEPQYDPEQLKMGIEIEKEHFSDIPTRTKIAKDHLREFPDYYTHLTAMEAKLKAKKKD